MSDHSFPQKKLTHPSLFAKIDGPSPTKHKAATEPLRILIVDDNIDSAKTTGWMLELIGHEPILAHDGLAALETAKKTHPDAILLDISLPGMSGYDVCSELRKDDAFKNTLIIAQTGWGQKKDQQKAMECGFNHHLLKPIGIDQIENLLTAKVKR
jgi:CheY-like chemotaxis protein